MKFVCTSLRFERSIPRLCVNVDMLIIQSMITSAFEIQVERTCMYPHYMQISISNAHFARV